MGQFPSWGIYLSDMTLQERVKTVQAGYRLYAPPEGYSEGAVVSSDQLSGITAILGMVNGTRTIVRDDEQGNITIVRYERYNPTIPISSTEWKLCVSRTDQQMNRIKGNIHFKSGSCSPTFYRKFATLLRRTLCRHLQSPTIDLYFSSFISCPPCPPSHFTVYFNYEHILSIREPICYWMMGRNTTLRERYSSGIPIEIGGHIVGELFPNALYFFGAFHEHMPSRIMPLVEKIIMRACELLGTESPSHQPTASYQPTQELALSAVKNKVLQVFQQRQKEDLSRKCTEKDSLNTQAANLVRDLTACYVRIGQLGQAIIALEQNPGIDPEDAWNRILSLPLVENIVPDANNSFAVITKPIHTLPVGGKVYDLGRYTLRFDLQDNQIYIKSLGLPYTSHNQAPHVGALGVPCYGNIASAVTELQAQRNYPALIQLILTFLRNVNTDDDWGRRVALWPTVKVKKKEEEPTVAIPSRETIDAINAI